MEVHLYAGPCVVMQLCSIQSLKLAKSANYTYNYELKIIMPMVKLGIGIGNWPDKRLLQVWYLMNLIIMHMIDNQSTSQIYEIMSSTCYNGNPNNYEFLYTPPLITTSSTTSPAHRAFMILPDKVWFQLQVALEAEGVEVPQELYLPEERERGRGVIVFACSYAYVIHNS